MRLFACLLLVPALVFANGDDDNGSAIADASAVSDALATASAVSNVTNTSTSGSDVNVTGSSHSSRAFAFSHSLGDVDINECIVTKQTGTFIISWQGYDYNVWCMGEVYDAKGLYDMAALMRCDIPLVRSHFSNAAECLEANTVPLQAAAPMVAPVEITASPEYREREREHDDQFEGLLERVDKMEEEKQANIRRYNRNQARFEQKQADDREFAQQTLEQLKAVRGDETQQN